MISVILPSIHEELFHRAVDNVVATSKTSIKIVAVTPFNPLSALNVHWIEWVPDPSNQGAPFAQALGAANATGDYIAAFADDFAFVDGWDVAILGDFLRRERKHGRRYLMGMRYDLGNWVGTCFGRYYPNFPFMRRAILPAVGWIDGSYDKGFGDCDFGMRFWAMGGRVEFSEAVALRCLPIDGNRKSRADLCTDEDMAQFVSRWAGKFGAGWKTENLFDFNRNVDAAPYMAERTVLP